jgi:hypothetical protein
MFDHFGQRLKRDLKQIVDRRIAASEQASGSVLRVRLLCLQYHLRDGVCDVLCCDLSHQVLKSTLSRISASGTLSGSVALCSQVCPISTVHVTPRFVADFLPSPRTDWPDVGRIRGVRPVHLPSIPDLWQRELSTVGRTADSIGMGQVLAL